MRGKKNQPLFSTEDKTLWKLVADTTTPLSAARGDFLKEEMSRLLDQSANLVAPGVKGKKQGMDQDTPAPFPPKKMNYRAAGKNVIPAPNLPSGGNLRSHPIEERIAKNLAKGRQNIDSRIDLHGMTQDRARFALLDFLQMAQMADYRIVLVITGKGNEGTGVLKRRVPDWFSIPAFASLVNGYRTSHSSHGGEGALYVRIRKLAGRSK